MNPDLELTGIQKGLDGSYPIVFNTVRGYSHVRALTNLFANYGIIERLFGWENSQDRTRKLAYALTHPIKPVEIDQRDAPCQQEVLTGELDVNQIIMAIRHTAQESELTVGSGNSVVYGPYFHGGSHIGYNRMNFRWGNVGTFQSAPGSHMWQIITEHYHEADPIPLTMCFGLPAACTLIAGGGFDYALTPSLAVFANALRTVWGENGHKLNLGLTTGISWHFRMPWARPQLALVQNQNDTQQSIWRNQSALLVPAGCHH